MLNDLLSRDGLRLRPETDDDLPFLQELYRSVRWPELAVTDWSGAQKSAFLAEQFRLQHRSYRTSFPDGQFWIVERAGAPVGRLYLAGAAGALHIVDISLLPEQRNRGCGRALLEAVIAAKPAHASVTLFVEETNPARRLYERLGFRGGRSDGLYLRMDYPAADDGRPD